MTRSATVARTGLGALSFAIAIVAACGHDLSSGEAAVRCGDGRVQPGEGCDLGIANSDAPDALCRIDCQPRRCGDGVVDPVAGEACDASAGDACGCRSDCSFEPTTTVCRASVGPCDADDTCDGAGGCRGDGKRVGTVCRAAEGACDAPERCSGEGDACPADGVRAAGEACRPSLGDCDAAEICDGVGASCGEDVRRPDGEVCTSDACRDGCVCLTGACVPHCGNGTREAELGETCDDGALGGTLGLCRSTCDGRCEVGGRALYAVPDAIVVSDVHVAPDGRRYVVGLQAKRTPQPPIGGVTHIVRDAAGDGVIIAVDPDGAVAWSQCLASATYVDTWSYVLPDDGGLTAIGSASPGARIGCCADADPSACPEVVPMTADGAVVVARFDRAGALAWSLYSPMTDFLPRGHALMPGGDVLFSGNLRSGAPLELGGVSMVAREPGSDGPKTDVALVRVSPTGVVRWGRTFGGEGNEVAGRVTVRPDGRIVFAFTHYGVFSALGHDFVTEGVSESSLVEIDGDATTVLGVVPLRGSPTAPRVVGLAAQGDGVWLAVEGPAQVLDFGPAGTVDVAQGFTLLRFTSLGGDAAPAVLSLPGVGNTGGIDTEPLGPAPAGLLVSVSTLPDFAVPGYDLPTPIESGFAAMLLAHEPAEAPSSGPGTIVPRWVSITSGAAYNTTRRQIGVDAAGRVTASQVTTGGSWDDVPLGAAPVLVTLGLPAGCDGCGDGVRAGREVCDDGDRSDCTGDCNAQCLAAADVCGDGVVRCGEVLDPSSPAGATGAPAPLPAGSCDGCGNGLVTPVEVCDGDALGRRDGCNLRCDGRCDVSPSWISRQGDGGARDAELYGLGAKPDGSVIVAGQFRTGATFGPLAGGGTITAQAHAVGDIDNYLYELDPAGNVVWATCFGSPDDFAEAQPRVVPDVRGAAGGVWVFGNTRSSIPDFCCPGIDPAPGVARSCDDDVVVGVDASDPNQGSPAFIARFDADGRFVRSRGGTPQLMDGARDDAGTLFVAAFQPAGRPLRWAGQADLPPSDGWDFTLLALAPDSATKWLRTFRAPGDQIPLALAVAPSAAPGEAALWLIGTTANGDLTLADDTVTAAPDGARSAFIAAFDGDGNPLWLKGLSALGTSTDVRPGSLVHACRAPGDCALFVAARLSAPTGEEELVVLRLGLDGTVQATARGALGENADVTTLGVDARGRVTVIGTFASLLALDGGPRLVAAPGEDSFDTVDVFVARADWDLGWLWARGFGNSDRDFLRAATPAPDGGVFLGWLTRNLEALVFDEVAARDVEARSVVVRLVPREDGCVVCGDGEVGSGEACDDGDTADCEGTCDAQCAGEPLTTTGGLECAP